MRASQVPKLSLLSFHLQELNIKIQSCVRGDDSARTAFTVPKFGGDDELANFSHAHAQHPLLPSFDHHSLSECEAEGLVTVIARVKLFAILCECTSVMNL